MFKLPCLRTASVSGRAKSSLSTTYAWTIRRSPTLFIVVSNFVEIILVQLPDETREIAVLKVFGQNLLREFLVLRCCQFQTACIVLRSLPRASRTTKLSPSLPHRTTFSSCGLSSILSSAISILFEIDSRNTDTHLYSLRTYPSVSHMQIKATMAAKKTIVHSQSRWSCWPLGYPGYPCLLSNNGARLFVVRSQSK